MSRRGEASAHGFARRCRGDAARRGLQAVGLILVLSASACGREGRIRDGASAEEPPEVAVSVAPVAGLVDRIAPPGAVRVGVLVPPGASPHSFEPGVATLREASGARLFLEIGHPALTWERTWLPSLTTGGDTRALAVASDCASVSDDPHVWLDPDCLGRMADRAAEGLSDLLPDRSAEIRQRLAGFHEELSATERTLEAQLRPWRGRAFFVLHPAWGYFAAAFGLEQVALLSHGAGDVGAARLASVVARARREGIHTIFVQPQYATGAARTVADEIGGRVVTLDPLGRDPLETLRATADSLEASFR